jgi:hypothetical protein
VRPRRSWFSRISRLFFADLPEEVQAFAKALGTQIPDSLVFHQRLDQGGPAKDAWFRSSLHAILSNVPINSNPATQQEAGTQQAVASAAPPPSPQLITCLLKAICSSDEQLRILPINCLRICSSVPSASTSDNSTSPTELAAAALQEPPGTSVWQLSEKDLRNLCTHVSRDVYCRLQYLQLSGLSALTSDSLYWLSIVGGLQQKLKFLSLAGSPGIKQGRLPFSGCLGDLCNSLRVLTVLDLRYTGRCCDVWLGVPNTF